MPPSWEFAGELGLLCLRGTVFGAEAHLEEQAEGFACVLRTLEAVDDFKQRSDTSYIRVSKASQRLLIGKTD